MQRRMKLRKKLSCLQLHRCARAIGNSLELRHSEGPGNDPKWPHRRNASPPLRTKFAPRHNEGLRNDPKWPLRHNVHKFMHKIRTAPRETTLRSKMATAPQRQPTLCTKFAPRHNDGPRNDPKWPPRRNASPLCSQNSHRHKGRPRYDPNCDRTTRAHSVITSSSRKENNLFLNFLNARSTLRLQVFLQPRGTFWS